MSAQAQQTWFRGRCREIVATLCAGTIVGCAGTSSALRTSDPIIHASSSSRLSQRDWRQREAEIQADLLERPRDPALHDQLGFACYQQGKFAAARAAYQRSLALSPSRSETRFRLANALADSRETEAALRQVDKVLRQRRDLPDAFALRGKLLRSLGRNDEALESLERAWKGNPPSVAGGVELAEFEIGRERDDRAADILRLCVAREPANVAARRMYAETLQRLDRPDEAIAQWETLIKQGEFGADAHFRLVELYRTEGRLDQAMEHWDDGQRIAPRDPRVQTLLTSMSKPTAGKPATGYLSLDRDRPPNP